MPQSTAPVIGFIDIDSFECQLWQRDYPHTRGQPCVVINSSGRILAATHEAKQLGVSRSATPNIRQARAVFPDIVVFKKPDRWGKPDTTKTRNGTWEVLDCIREFCNKTGRGNDIIVEMASSDEFYLDISCEVNRGLENILQKRKFVNIADNIVHEKGKISKQGPFQYYLKTSTPGKKEYWQYQQQDETRIVIGALFMSDLCRYLVEKTQLSASAGVGSNKLLAKVGCGINKPGKVTIFHEAAINRVAALIPIDSIPGLGGQAGEKLMKELGIKMVSELREIPLDKLEALFDSELAQKIFSWARGKDNQPVVEKLMTDHFTCNKPNTDVTNMNHLNMTISNLCREVLERLQEEKLRNKRVTNQVTFGFTLVTPSGEASSDITDLDLHLDLGDENKCQNLINNARDFLIGHTSFNESKFRVQKLKLMVQNYVPQNPTTVDTLSTAFNQVSLTDTALVPKKELPVHYKFDRGLTPRFANRKHIGSFRSTADQGYSSSDVDFPKLISWLDMMNLKGRYLGHGYEEAARNTMITDHTLYYEIKHRCFIEWLREIKFMENVKDGKFKKPDFIGFGGRFMDPMRSPAIKQFGDWEMFAVNVGGIIYLWDEKKPQRANTVESYYGIYFERISTTQDKTMKEDEMGYVVTEVGFGNHQLLVVSNIDAVDENEEWTEIAVWKVTPRNFNSKFGKMVKTWTQCAVNGVQKILLGSRNESGILENVEMQSLDDMAKELGDKTSSCLYFQDQLLSFIKSHLPESNRNVVKKFSWVCGQRNVICADVQVQSIPNLVFPRIYTSYLNQIE